MTANEVLKLAKSSGVNLSIALSGAISAKGRSKDIARLKPVIEKNKIEILIILQQEYKISPAEKRVNNFFDKSSFEECLEEQSHNELQDNCLSLPANQHGDKHGFKEVESSGTVENKPDNLNTVFPIYSLEILNQFRFDLIEGSVNSVQEIDRVNNMAWEFMKVDGLAFNEAIRMAAEIVVSCDVSACEAAYEDVQTLWIRLSGK